MQLQVRGVKFICRMSQKVPKFIAIHRKYIAKHYYHNSFWNTSCDISHAKGFGGQIDMTCQRCENVYFWNTSCDISHVKNESSPTLMTFHMLNMLLEEFSGTLHVTLVKICVFGTFHV
jgi:hypothetical protein